MNRCNLPFWRFGLGDIRGSQKLAVWPTNIPTLHTRAVEAIDRMFLTPPVVTVVLMMYSTIFCVVLGPPPVYQTTNSLFLSHQSSPIQPLVKTKFHHASPTTCVIWHGEWWRFGAKWKINKMRAPHSERNCLCKCVVLAQLRTSIR